MRFIIFVLGCFSGAAIFYVYFGFSSDRKQKGTLGENYFLKETYPYGRYFFSVLGDSFEDGRFSIENFEGILSDELSMSDFITTAESVLFWGYPTEHRFPSDFGILIPRGTSENQSFDFIFIFYTERNNLYEIVSMNIGGERRGSLRYYKPLDELLFDAPKIRGGLKSE